MSTATSTYTTLTTPSSTNISKTPRSLGRRRKGDGIGTAASTPNLNQLYSSHSLTYSARLAPSTPGLARKGSFAALTQSSLASIPDDSEYGFNSVLTTSDRMPSPLTPGRGGGSSDETVAVGDTVDVPGAMSGTVRFIGSVQGRKGVFAGVELHRDFASRGKNSGDVDGVSYFTTTKPGAGIFVPLSKAVKRDGSATAASFPMTPSTSNLGGLKPGNQNSTNYTPPTPSLPKFSQSVGPGRAPSPSGKKPRTSLPRPDSPVRRLQMTPGPRPSIATPGPKGASRFGSPTTTAAAGKFGQSMRSTAGDPSKRLPSITPTAPPATTRERKGSIGPRSASALGSTSTGSAAAFTDDENTPVAAGRTARMDTSISSVSSFGLKARPASRAASRAASRMGNQVGGGGGSSSNDLEVAKLRAQLEDRERQLKDQAATLAEMESTLTELQGLIESSDGPLGSGAMSGGRRDSQDDTDASQLRMLLREKNEKIAMLTAEFDAHRADFRSTIDTLEMASTETERVYEKKIEELMQEIQDMQDRTADVDSVATQLKQLEELVQELEEGLEDARRGEAEARGEVEFLRGEVERTRSELRREREKAQADMGNGVPDGESLSKELKQKEDEIRGLKAIIYSLSRDSVPNDAVLDRTPTQRPGSFLSSGDPIEDRLTREKLEREVADLRALVESRNSREEELEREVELLRRGSVIGPNGTDFRNSNNVNGGLVTMVTSVGGSGQRGSAMTLGGSEHNSVRNSVRDSRGTVVHAPRSPEALAGQQRGSYGGLANRHSHTHSRGRTLDTMPESDSYSTATENSTLWCEICETAGHDILTCTNMFGPESQQQSQLQPQDQQLLRPQTPLANGNSVSDAPQNLALPRLPNDASAMAPAPLSPLPVRTKTATAPPPGLSILPNPMEAGPVAGKESGVVDASKWCALCERDGHDSVDCPFEDAF